MKIYRWGGAGNYLAFKNGGLYHYWDKSGWHAWQSQSFWIETDMDLSLSEAKAYVKTHNRIAND